jgi:hypothetical protein
MSELTGPSPDGVAAAGLRPGAKDADQPVHGQNGIAEDEAQAAEDGLFLVPEITEDARLAPDVEMGLVDLEPFGQAVLAGEGEAPQVGRGVAR